MKRLHRLLFVSAALTLPLAGCQSFFDDVGRHMPVMGERCENWQCFTEGGQAQSEATKRALQAEQERKRKPLNGDEAPAQKPAEPVKAAPKEPTPFDMTPEQLQDMSSPSPF